MELLRRQSQNSDFQPGYNMWWWLKKQVKSQESTWIYSKIKRSDRVQVASLKTITSPQEVSLLPLSLWVSVLGISCRSGPRLVHFLLSDQSMYARVLGKVSTGGANLSAAAVMRSGHIDSGTLGGTALLHGWVRSQLALAALCGQLPQSIGINVTVRATRAVLVSGDEQKWH